MTFCTCSRPAEAHAEGRTGAHVQQDLKQGIPSVPRAGPPHAGVCRPQALPGGCPGAAGMPGPVAARSSTAESPHAVGPGQVGWRRCPSVRSKADFVLQWLQQCLHREVE